MTDTPAGGESHHTRRTTDHIPARIYLLFLAVFSLVPYLYLSRMVGFALIPWSIITAGYAVVWGALYMIFRRKSGISKQQVTGPAEPEKETGHLSGLSAEYRVLRKVRLPGKDTVMDTVIVGPTGVWTCDTKGHSGDIGYDEQADLLKINGHPFESDVLKDAWSAAAACKHFLKKQTGIDTIAQPVLVFPSEHARMDFGLYPVRGVHVIREPQMEQLVTGYGKDKLAERDRMKIVSALRAL